MLRKLLSFWSRRSRADAELADEIQAHLAIEKQRRVASGEPPEAAHQAALRDFGNVLMVQEETRDTWGWTRLEQLWIDLRHGVRLLRLNPIFTVVAVLSLALGVGANTALFQLITEVRFRSLPVPHPHELVEIRIVGGNGGMGLNPGKYARITRPMWEETRRHQEALTGVFAWNQLDVRIGMDSERRRAAGLSVSGEFFPLLGVTPWRGRLFSPEDEMLTCPVNRVVISHSFWQREFGERDPASGLKVVVNGVPHEVIGVTSPAFTGLAVGESFDLAFPFCKPQTAPRRDRFAFTVMGRLKPGWTIERAAAHFEALSPGIMEATEIQGYSPQTTSRYRQFRLSTYPAHNGVSALREQYDSALWLLLGIAGLVLLIACTNLANLVLARSTAREKEIALRRSLGASRARLLCQFTLESALLAIIGGVIGVGLAQVLGKALVYLMTTQEGAIHLAFGLDWRVLAFSASVAALTCLIFGTLPAIRVTRLESETLLRAGRGLTAGRRNLRAQRAMVVVQISVSLVLLVGALLFTGSFAKLMTFDAGMRQDGISVAFVGMPGSLPKDRISNFHVRLLEVVRTIPGVRSAGTTSNVPLLGSSWGHAIEVGAAKGGANFTWISPGYFDTMGIPLITGRDFDQRDTGSSPGVAVVNQAFVKAYCGASNPLGQKLRTAAEPGFPSTIYEVVGVVPDTRYRGLRDNASPSVFAPGLQFPQLGPWANLMIYRDSSHSATAAAVRAALAREFPELVVELQDFRGRVVDGLVRERILAMLSGFFGVLGTLLATIGLFGVVSYLVSRKRAEIGIRVALGARRTQIVSMVMKEAVRLLLPGIAIGVVLSLVATRGAGSLLFGLTPHDPLILAGAIVLLAAITLVASLLPARKAANVSPLVALRND